MRRYSILTDIIRVEITTAEPVKLISALNQAGIVIEQVDYIDALTVQLNIFRKNQKLVQKMLQKHGAKMTKLQLLGTYWRMKQIFHRPILLIGLLALILLSVYLPSQILFVRVLGNSNTPTQMILEKAELSGICFGANRREIRSEQVKNSLLEQLPQLQWVGINTDGCVATISVREKDFAEDSTKEKRVNSIVASCDGLIVEATVSKGSALFTVGQAVKAGQKLVSGYVDCGLSICATGAEAEIFALTSRKIQVISPSVCMKRGRLISVSKRSWYQIGKKLYNFNNNSRILDTTCVKIYDKDVLSLPGGLSLPVYRITETSYYYELVECSDMFVADSLWLQDFSRDYLLGHMVAGQILHVTQAVQKTDKAYEFEADYTCIEMIGKSQTEEIIQ